MLMVFEFESSIKFPRKLCMTKKLFKISILEAYVVISPTLNRRIEIPYERF